MLLRVDLSCAAYWDAHPAERPSKLTVVLRIWSLDPGVYFRSDWDPPELDERVDSKSGRVMIRTHFDLANPKQPGPRYHLQVGGKPLSTELCWFPEGIAVPRYLHNPLDVVLASELVAATFFPSVYERVRREGSWKGSIRVSQCHLLESYFSDALDAIRNKDSVLDALWNVTWGVE